MKVFKEKEGVISKESCWVCIHDEYLYTADTYLKLLWVLMTQWENDKHLVG
jgi:hypothetical protein